VLREALEVMSKAAGEVVVPVTSSNGTSINRKAVKKGLPLLFMRTVILAVQGFPELKQYVAVGLLPRCVRVRYDTYMVCMHLLCAVAIALVHC
jgi:Symplekin tight junction protein C terminal